MIELQIREEITKSVKSEMNYFSKHSESVFTVDTFKLFLEKNRTIFDKFEETKPDYYILKDYCKNVDSMKEYIDNSPNESVEDRMREICISIMHTTEHCSLRDIVRYDLNKMSEVEYREKKRYIEILGVVLESMRMGMKKGSVLNKMYKSYKKFNEERINKLVDSCIEDKIKERMNEERIKVVSDNTCISDDVLKYIVLQYII